MPWRASVNPDVPIIETYYSGVLTQSELSAAVHETIELCRTYGRTLLLGDCTALVGGHSVVDLYVLADFVMASGIGHTIKEAVLLPELPASAENVKFWETTCYNRGFSVRLFNDREGALKWLLA